MFKGLHYVGGIVFSTKKPPSLRTKKRTKTGPKIIVMKRGFLVGIILILLIVGIFFFVNFTKSGNTESTITPQFKKSLALASFEYKISIIDNSTGGNITNNTLLMDNINKTPVISELLQASQNGTPMIRLGNGSQPRVMIVAGVHGAELPSQIAASNLINHLTCTKFNGTIYIIPFAIPRDTATSTRIHNNTDPNRVADIPGTAVNKISQTAKNEKVTLLMDCHSTKPHDIPGKNCIIYDSKNPKSLKLALYIYNNTKSPLIKVGNYSGVLSTVCNSNNITSVTCEVLSPHNQIHPGSDKLTYQYMIAFLNYAGVYSKNNKKNK